MDTTLQGSRHDKDAFFAQDPRSPLRVEQRNAFAGLVYFPEDLALVFRVRLDPPDDRSSVSMPTTDGRTQIYARRGTLRFEVDDGPGRLTLFSSERAGGFLPFRDRTNGRETYAGGRYLDVEIRDGVVLLDFNRAYNPYCAYNPDWSCPIPPPENWLEVPIRAGECAFADG
ncbi:MAG: DUF1684 domain-containing protein [Actinomycetota bacterium]